MTSKTNEFKRLAMLNIFIIVFYATLLLVGTFYDEKISEALYNPHGLVVMWISGIGAYPFFAFAVLFGGCLYERTLHSDLKKALKFILCVLLILVITAVGFVGAGALVDKDSLGYIYPQLNRNIPVILCISLVSIFPLTYLGYKFAESVADEKLLKRVIGLLLIFIIAYVLLQIVKGIFHRPRYRLTLQGFEGIGFVPWFKPFFCYQDYIEQFGIDKGEFRSFPSGHSILSTCMVIGLQSLSRISLRLWDKQFRLGLLGFVISFIIIISRVILGAHYLSDVSAGALIVSVLALFYTYGCKVA
ncbi:phosphatase PAP2 family protein [Butyrivibrio sp. JL13D10]|uniref:phosphatase PAP2 family protein n=1 Tax=Butyrivibrio sp. JL13D10 TaxID=3236815 RepID=UPI0038B5EF00